MAIREDKIGEIISIDDVKSYIPPDHPCFLVEKIVDRVDFSEWEEEHWDKPGNPAYHPRVLLRGVVQGYIDGVKSGRQVGRRVKTDLAYIYLCGVDGPDFRTFNRFYKEFADVIVCTIVETIDYAKEIGMLTIGVLGLDSTSVKANASTYNVASEKQINAILKTVYYIILKNEEEDELFGDQSGDEVPINLEDDEEFEKIYQNVVEYAKEQLDGEKLKFPARKQLKNAIKNPEKTIENLETSLENLKKSGQNTVNLTDNQCRWHHNKKNYEECGYYVQNIVELTSGLTMLSQAIPLATDSGQFVPMFELFEELYGPIGNEIPLDADYGYWGEETLIDINKHCWDAYIPNKLIASCSKKSPSDLDKFSDYNFIFSEDFTYCTCPNGHKLWEHPIEMTEKGLKTSYHVNHSVICKFCPDHDQCCYLKRIKEIIVYRGDPETEMFMKMQTQKGREIYEPRFSRGESPFGIAKEHKGMRQARAKGTENITLQASLTSIATNIIKINNYEIKNKKNT